MLWMIEALANNELGELTFPCALQQLARAI